jgi:hypothetical protein
MRFLRTGLAEAVMPQTRVDGRAKAAFSIFVY